MTQTKTLRLTHLVRPPRRDTQTAGGERTAPPMLVLLHGVGSNERDLFELAPSLDERLLIVSARAPNTRTPGSYAWYEVQFTPDGPVYDPAQAEAARTILIDFLGEAAEAYGADPRRVILGGFSQGAIMSGAVGLSRPDLVAGVAMMSGRVLPEVRSIIAPPDQLEGKPFLVVHGTQDQVLPIEYGREVRDLLQSLPVDLTYNEYPMPHTVGERSLRDVAAWLSARLDEQEATRA